MEFQHGARLKEKPTTSKFWYAPHPNLLDPNTQGEIIKFGILVWKDDATAESTYSFRGSGSIPCTHMTAHQNPLLQFQGIQCFLPTSESTRHRYDTQIYMQDNTNNTCKLK